MLSKQEIAGLRELLAKATPGWRTSAARGYVLSPECQVAKFGDFTDAELVPYNGERWIADAHLAVAMFNALPALLDIAEAVANGLTCEVRECCGHVIIGNEWDDEDATNKLIGKRVIVLPLAGEVANG